MVRNIDIATCLPGFKPWFLTHSQAKHLIYKKDKACRIHSITVGNVTESPGMILGHTSAYLD